MDRKGLIQTIHRQLNTIHEHGLIHGDLKPDNILIDAETGEPILIDWGAAQSIGNSPSANKPRQYSLGFSHPDLIFGRTKASIDWDYYSVERLIEWHKA